MWPNLVKGDTPPASPPPAPPPLPPPPAVAASCYLNRGFHPVLSFSTTLPLPSLKPQMPKNGGTGRQEWRREMGETRYGEKMIGGDKWKPKTGGTGSGSMGGRWRMGDYSLWSLGWRHTLSLAAERKKLRWHLWFDSGMPVGPKN